MNSKVKDWMPLNVMTDFEDHNKLKNMVVVVLPTRLAHYNTTYIDVLVASTQGELIIKIIWPHNMTDVKMLLGQFATSWHQDDIDMQKRLALEKTFNQLREKATGFVWSKAASPYCFMCSLKLILSLFSIMTTDSMH